MRESGWSRRLVLVLVLALAGCGETITGLAGLREVEIRGAPSEALLPNDTVQLGAVLLESGLEIRSSGVLWSSSDSSVVRIEESGLALAVAPGVAVVSAEIEGRRGSVGLTVAAPAEPEPVRLWTLDRIGNESPRLLSAWVAPSGVVYGGGWLNGLFRFEAGAWTPVGGSPLAISQVHDIWGSSDTDIYAATSGLLHFDGSSWTKVISASYYAVWGSSANDVFAVGSRGQIDHFDGHTWSSMSSGTGQNLNAVWGSSPTDVYAGGAGVLLHFDGTWWSPVTTPAPELIYRIWGTGPSNVYAAGESSVDQRGTVMHYDGSRWDTVLGAVSEYRLTVLWGTGPNDIYVGGERLDAGRTSLLHWDGAGWSRLPEGSPDPEPVGMAGHDPGDLHLIGSNGSITRFDGSRWSKVFVAGGLSDLWGDGNGDLFGVGAGGRIVHSEGGSWRDMESGTLRPLNAVWGSSADDVFAVGDGGIAVHYDGSEWSTLGDGDVVGGRDLNAVWGTSGRSVYAVGEAGTIIHWDGSSWHSMPSGTESALLGIWGRADDDVYAIADTLIIHYDGSTWRAIESGGSVSVRAVSGQRAGPAFAVGCVAVGAATRYTSAYYGQVFRLESGRAVPEWTGDPTCFTATWVESERVAYAGTSDGSIYFRSPDGWSPVSPPLPTPIAKLWGTGPDRLYAVTTDGSLYLGTR